jgi:hypothetical protein
VLETVDDIRRDSLDPYVTIRTSYGLLRESAIQNGPADVEDLPEFEDIDPAPASEELEAPASGEESQQSAPIQNTPHAVTLAKTFSATTSLAVAGDWK